MRPLIIVLVILSIMGCGSSPSNSPTYPVQEVTFKIGAYVGVFSNHTGSYQLVTGKVMSAPIYLKVIPNAAIGDLVTLKAMCYVLGPNDYDQVDTTAKVYINEISYDAYTPTKGN
jgi:hypothetical protein